MVVAEPSENKAQKAPRTSSIRAEWAMFFSSRATIKVLNMNCVACRFALGTSVFQRVLVCWMVVVIKS